MLPAISTPVGPRRRGHLIEKRLEQVVVLAVDNRRADAGLSQGLRDLETSEAPTDDYDARGHVVLVRIVRHGPHARTLRLLRGSLSRRAL